MGYKNTTENLIIHIDVLREDCGLSFIGEENNGYCCRSRSNGKSEPGCCHVFDCPLAFEAQEEDIKEYGDGEDVTERGYVVQYRRVLTEEVNPKGMTGK